MSYISMKNNEWMFQFKNVTFELTLDASQRTTTEKIMLMKTESMLGLYDELFERVHPKRVVEFGIFEGGSPLYFGSCKPLDKYVGIDLRLPSATVISHVSSLGLQERVKLYYETSQDDRVALEKIIESEFCNVPLDMVIDDASHLLRPSRSTFEIMFPKLRHGGVYVLEDWGWAHWAGSFQEPMGQWHDQPALSNLVFEITMAMASDPQLISRIEIGGGAWLFITRGPGDLPAGEFSLSSIIRNRGRALQPI